MGYCVCCYFQVVVVVVVAAVENPNSMLAPPLPRPILDSR